MTNRRGCVRQGDFARDPWSRHERGHPRLPMNRTPSSRPSPPVGEKVPGGRLRGIPNGSWLRFTSEFWGVSPLHEPGGTSNIEQPTPNIEWQHESSLTSAFEVQCSPSVRGFQRSNFHFGEFLPRLAGRELLEISSLITRLNESEVPGMRLDPYLPPRGIILFRLGFQVRAVIKTDGRNSDCPSRFVGTEKEERIVVPHSGV